MLNKQAGELLVAPGVTIPAKTLSYPIG